MTKRASASSEGLFVCLKFTKCSKFKVATTAGVTLAITVTITNYAQRLSNCSFRTCRHSIQLPPPLTTCVTWLLPVSACCRSTFLGSRALAGTLLKHKQLSARGPDGLSLEELLKSTGVQRPAEAVAAIALDPKKVCV